MGEQGSACEAELETAVTGVERRLQLTEEQLVTQEGRQGGMQHLKPGQTPSWNKWPQPHDLPGSER